MSTVQGGQGNIVTNGLVLNLDAANPRSYAPPFNGTTWQNIAPVSSSLTGSLVGGVAYTGSNGGALVFDGINDYVDNIGTTSTFSFIQNTGIFTICSWVRLTDLSVARYFMGNNDGSTISKGFYLGHSGTNGRLWLAITYGVGGQLTVNLQQNNFFIDNNWVFVTCVGNGTTCQFYRNGQIFGSSGNFIIFSTGDSARLLSIGRINNFNTSYWQGNIASTQIYNRALNPSEVLQNYNATRARFGI